MMRNMELYYLLVVQISNVYVPLMKFYGWYFQILSKVFSAIMYDPWLYEWKLDPTYVFTCRQIRGNVFKMFFFPDKTVFRFGIFAYP